MRSGGLFSVQFLCQWLEDCDNSEGKVAAIDTVRSKSETTSQSTSINDTQKVKPRVLFCLVLFHSSRVNLNFVVFLRFLCVIHTITSIRNAEWERMLEVVVAYFKLLCLSIHDSERSKNLSIRVHPFQGFD